MKKQLSFFFSLLVLNTLSFAQTTTLTSNGNWNDASKWSNGVPNSSKDAIIGNNRTCTVNVANAICKSLTLEDGNRNATVFISGSNQLTVVNDVDIQTPTANNYVKKVDVANGTLIVGGDIILDNTGGSNRDCLVDIGNGTITLDGDFIFEGASNENTLDFTGTGTLNIKGTITGSGTLNEASGTINYNNAGNQTVAGTTYNNLTISGSGVKSMNGDVTVNGTLQLDAGNLSIGNNILGVNGDIINNAGSLRGGITSDLAISGSAGNATIKMDQTSSSTRSLNNLNLSRSNGANLGDTLELDGILTITNNATLGTNNKLILVSTASANARVASLAAGTVSGKVIAQRYVPGGEGRRRWRFFSSPVNISGNYNYYQFIDDMHVTGAGGATNGFDNSPNNSPSARTYNESVAGASSNGWNNPTVLNTNIPIGRGVSVFVRGSRNTVDPFLNWATPDNTTVDFTGELNQGDIDISSVLSYTNTGTPTADGFNLIGNPYMSQIDWMSNNITKTNIGNVIYVTNPSSGAYATFDVGTLTGVNGGSRYIESSQGFFVRTTAASPSIIFRETAKTSSAAPDFFRMAKNVSLEIPKIRLRAIRDQINTDELVIVFGDTAHKTAVDQSDAPKFFNDNNLNFYSRTPQLTNLAINYFPIPNGVNSDTISLSFFSFVDGVKALGAYTIKADEILNLPGNVDVLLLDNYANQLVNFKEAQSYVFTLDLNAASAGNDRFKLILRPDTSTKTSIKNFSANVQNKRVNLTWNTNKERNIAYYTVEKSTNSRTYHALKPNQVLALNNGSSYNTYTINDVKPSKGNNYYRVIMVDSNGNRSIYQEIIVVNYDPKATTNAQRVASTTSEALLGEHRIAVYPNPANSNTNITIYTDAEESNVVSIYYLTGKLVMQFEQESMEMKNIDLNNLEKGLYLIQSVSKLSGKTYKAKFIKE
jgi:Secretion system C-terminal sorting domain